MDPLFSLDIVSCEWVLGSMVMFVCFGTSSSVVRCKEERAGAGMGIEDLIPTHSHVPLFPLLNPRYQEAGSGSMQVGAVCGFASLSNTVDHYRRSKGMSGMEPLAVAFDRDTADASITRHGALLELLLAIPRSVVGR